MKTLSDLKKELAIGKCLKKVYASINSNNLNKPRYIVKIQSNGVYLADDKNATKGSFLEYPKVSLLEITDKGFKIYQAGDRDLTQEEQEVLNNIPQDAEQMKTDLMTDTNVMFYRKKRYLQEKGFSYLGGHIVEKGLRYNFNTKKVTDDKIKGLLNLEYEFSEGL